MATRNPFSMTNPRDWFRNELQNFFRDLEQGSFPGRGRTRSARRTTGVFPRVNLYDDGEGFRLIAELPGVDEESLEINAKREQLDIRGERNIEPADEDASYHRRERNGGRFRRTLTLPDPIELEGVTARLEQGVLDVYAPRAEDSKPKQIDIEA